MSGDAVFLYGPNQAPSIPYTYSVLPRKVYFKDHGKKIAGFVILFCWIQHEVTTALSCAVVIVKGYRPNKKHGRWNLQDGQLCSIFEREWNIEA